MRRSGLRFSTLEKKEEIAVSNEFEINRGIFITVITVYHTHTTPANSFRNQLSVFVEINFPPRAHSALDYLTKYYRNQAQIHHSNSKLDC